MDPKERFISLYRQYIHREGAEELLSWMEQTDFFTAPASARYHSCYAGGLCQHSINVFECLWAYIKRKRVQEIYQLSTADYSDESLAIVGLLHDLCKTNVYKAGFRNVKDDNGQWQRVPNYTFEDNVPYGHGEKSVFMINRFMKLTDMESFAIRFHMGFSGDEDNRMVGQALAKYPLAFAVSVADSEATYFLEK